MGRGTVYSTVHGPRRTIYSTTNDLGEPNILLCMDSPGEDHFWGEPLTAYSNHVCIVFTFHVPLLPTLINQAKHSVSLLQ